MDATTVMPRPATTGRVPAGLLYGLRITVTAQAAAVLVAASFAGQAVESGAMSEIHVMAGMVVHLVALVQIVLAVLVRRPGRGAGRPALASVVLIVAGGLQLVTWGPAAHLPTGVLLVGLVAAVLIWAWSPAVARRR